jgi:hypothetical protein
MGFAWAIMAPRLRPLLRLVSGRSFSFSFSWLFFRGHFLLPLKCQPRNDECLPSIEVGEKIQMDKKTDWKGASNDLSVPGSFRFKWIRKSCRSATGKTGPTTSRADSEEPILVPRLRGLNNGVHFLLNLVKQFPVRDESKTG